MIEKLRENPLIMVPAVATAATLSAFAIKAPSANANKVLPVAYAQHNCPADSATIDPTTGQPTSFEVRGNIRVSDVPVGSQVFGVYTIYAGKEGGRSTSESGVKTTYGPDQPMLSGTFTTEKRTREDADGIVEAPFATRLQSAYAKGTYIKISGARVLPRDEKITFTESPEVDLACEPTPPPTGETDKEKEEEKICPIVKGAVDAKVDLSNQTTLNRPTWLKWQVRSRANFDLHTPEIKITLPKGAIVVGALDPRLDLEKGRFVTLDRERFSPTWSFTKKRVLFGTIRIAFNGKIKPGTTATRTASIIATAEQQNNNPDLECSPASDIDTDATRVSRIPAGSVIKREPAVAGER